MVRLRWGADSPGDAGEARHRLVDAAEACYHRYGVAKTTVEDVAEAARVSRATVYRYFNGRDELLLAVLLRHARVFLGRLESRLTAQPDTAEAIVDGIAYTIRSVRKDETLMLLFTPESAGVTSSIAGTSQALFELSIGFLRPMLEAAREAGQLRPGVTADDAAEWLLRAILSLISIEGPKRRTDAQTRDLVRIYVVPAIVRTVDAGHGASSRAN